MTDPRPDSPEPRSVTLGDLMALTLGVAIAASLVWFTTPSVAGMVGRKTAPGWYAASSQAYELLQKACVALVPVILIRRARFGGPLRPVEYLPILTATMLVAYSLSRWPVFGLYHGWVGSSRLSVNPEAYYVWELSKVAVGALAFLVWLGRRRRPDWISGALLAVAWQMLATWICYFYQGWANARLLVLRPTPYVGLVSTFLVWTPQIIVYYLPVMIALIDLARPTRPGRSWIVGAAAVVSLSLLALGEGRNVAQSILDPSSFLLETYRIIGKILALAASFALARWTEPTWRRIFEGSPVGDGPEFDRNRRGGGRLRAVSFEAGSIDR